MACTKYVESADQPLLVLLGVWHHEQVVPSFRCPAWKASCVNAPSSWWHLLQRASSTIARRAVKPVATFCALGAITMRPPCLQTFVADVAQASPAAVGAVTGYAGRFVWVSGSVLVLL